MFWLWFWDLYHDTFGNVQPCPSCNLRPSMDCGFLFYDAYSGDYDCEAPEDGIDCDGCIYLRCDVCLLRGENEGAV